MNKSGVRFRIIVSVSSNVLRVVLGFATGLMIARTLGPADYGNFSFLLGSFVAFANLVDMGTSSAFYTFVSQQARGPRFLVYYAFWVAVQFGVLVIFVVLLPASLKQQIWLGQSSRLIILALLASFSMNQLWIFTGQVGESLRDTLGVQLRNVALTVAYLLSVAGLIYFHLATLDRLLLANAALYAGVAVVYWIKLLRVIPFGEKTPATFRGMFAEFKSYVFPLMTAIGFCYAFLDPWLLQKFGGAEQQGFYSVGAKVAAISFIAATAISQVLWKELAEAHKRVNHERVRMLFATFARGLFMIPAIIGCSFIPYAREILTTTVGHAYMSAWLPFSIMLLYPLHQSLNIVYDITLLATGHVRTRSRIVIVFFILSIAASYFFLAPRSAIVPGMALGALGLTCKMVICQVIQTCLNGYYASKYIKSSFDWIFQIIVPGLLVPLGFGSKYLAQFILSGLNISEAIPARVLLFGILYLGTIAIVLYRFPYLAGLSRQQLSAELIALKRWAYPA